MLNCSVLTCSIVTRDISVYPLRQCSPDVKVRSLYQNGMLLIILYLCSVQYLLALLYHGIIAFIPPGSVRLVFLKDFFNCLDPYY
jgi:hypothetical protein